MQVFSIGELSRLSGVKVPTIRYYEGIGLIPPAVRTDGNQRRFDAGALKRLRLIAHARAMGFSMHSVAAILRLARHPEEPCDNVDALVRERLDEVDARIGQLSELRRELASLLEGHSHGSVGECRIMEVLADGDPRMKSRADRSDVGNYWHLL